MEADSITSMSVLSKVIFINFQNFINKNVIIDLLPNIRKFKSNDSKIILSGLLISDKQEVVNLINKLEFN